MRKTKDVSSAHFRWVFPRAIFSGSFYDVMVTAIKQVIRVKQLGNLP